MKRCKSGVIYRIQNLITGDDYVSSMRTQAKAAIKKALE
jgi:hypothetical protein